MKAQQTLDEHPMTIANTLIDTPAGSDGSRRRLALPSPGTSTMDRRQAAGFAAIGLGALGIVVAWFQVAGERELWKQLPYLASGGIGGAAAIAIGIALLIAYEHSADRAALDVVLDRLDDLDARLDNLDARLETPSGDSTPTALEHRIAELEAALAELRRPRTARAGQSRAGTARNGK